MIMVNSILGISKNLFVILVIVFCILAFTVIFIYFSVVFVDREQVVVVENRKGKRRIIKRGVRFILPFAEKIKATISVKEVFVPQNSLVSSFKREKVCVYFQYSYIITDPLKFCDVDSVKDLVSFSLTSVLFNLPIIGNSDNLDTTQFAQQMNFFLEKRGFKILSLELTFGR